ncbi:MAG: HAD-IA family hydrolase [Chloroflexi bacterium]|jgi:HAD superfamily hydrolase (TIGR01509 family)|nr:HAD-IA family hydrolase [Chloroflexota bacterium]
MTEHTPTCQAVIFDMDGLLLDTEPISKRAWLRALEAWDATLTDEVYLQLVGRTVADTVRILSETLGPDLPIPAVRTQKDTLFEEIIADEGIPLKPGAVALLDYLERAGYPKAVASSTPKAGVLQRLSMTGLRERFSVIVGGDEVRRGKPSPDIFLAAAERLGVAPEGCWVLEDSEYGIAAAHAAGMTPIMIPDLKPPSAETAALAYRVLPSLADVQAMFSTFRETSANLLQTKPSN